MELRVNDYVRTKKGEIGKIIGYIDEPTDYYFNCYVTTLKNNFTDTYITEYNTNIKSSPNIIDLIEVGDIITTNNLCGEITKIDGDKIYTTCYDGEYCSAEDIKSIVTKEQFESMEYKVGE